MNSLRSYLKRKGPRPAPCRETERAVDDSVPIHRTERQRRVFEWQIGSCPKCSKYLEEYRRSVTGGHGAQDERGVASASSPATLRAVQPASDERGAAEFEVFASSPLFRGLPPRDLKRIFAQGEILELDEGATVIEEGKVNSGLYVVLQGEFRVSLPAGPDRYGEVELARRKPPDCFGEYAFIDYKLASANVAATAPSRLFGIRFETVDGFIDSDPEFGRALYENLLLLVAERLRGDDTELDVFRPA